MGDPAIREKAKQLFVENGLSMDTIVKMLDGDVSRKTLYNWRKVDEWDELRVKETKKAESLKGDLYDLTRQAIQDAKVNLNPRTIFAVAKLLSALQAAQKVSLLETPEEVDTEKQKIVSQETIDFVKKEILGII